MIKKLIVIGLFASIFANPVIAQPLNFLDDFSPESNPQNYLYDEIYDVDPYYNMELYRTYDVLSRRVMSYQHSLGFHPGECTYYVAQRRSDLFAGYGKNVLQGDAYERIAQAQQQGLSIGAEPKERAIAVFAPGRGAHAFGHVAYVEHVGSDGRIVISEMNLRNRFEITERVVPANLAQAYIY